MLGVPARMISWWRSSLLGPQECIQFLLCHLPLTTDSSAAIAGLRGRRAANGVRLSIPGRVGT
eukprot:CAMPEP_0169198584 /NCGR_PEP_ID=MMETSP1016-20121227/8891_1 /TAXON_ID=342587 /ORGANISM="Karlodinium micrum, Strain CCMP2283" /LENGTH=62 /DNA_ID=CAMNT_0009275331 /DNA_START=301 /DNA_END=489 /DNA_ORIENTATION=-